MDNHTHIDRTLVRRLQTVAKDTHVHQQTSGTRAHCHICVLARVVRVLSVEFTPRNNQQQFGLRAARTFTQSNRMSGLLESSLSHIRRAVGNARLRSALFCARLSQHNDHRTAQTAPVADTNEQGQKPQLGAEIQL